MAETSIALTGQTQQITIPDICPHCGMPAKVPLKVAKVFARRRRSGNGGWHVKYVVSRIEAFFCLTCAEQHRLETPPIRLRQWLEFGFKAAVFGVPGSIALGLGLEVGMRIFGFWVRGDLTGFLFILPFVLFFLGMGLWLLRRGWLLGYPALVRPQTSITRSFDFSDDLSQDFEPAWRHYTFTHPDYARAFQILNAHRVWRADGNRAEAARGLRLVRNIVLAVLITVFLLLGVLQKYFPGVVKQFFGS